MEVFMRPTVVRITILNLIGLSVLVSHSAATPLPRTGAIHHRPAGSATVRTGTRSSKSTDDSFAEIFANAQDPLPARIDSVLGGGACFPSIRELADLNADELVFAFMPS